MDFYRAVVEDNQDPEQLGRVKVRIFGIHTQYNENAGEDFEFIKVQDLPWAEVMGGTAFGLISGVGVSSVLRQGTWVWVTLDHGNPNMPIVIGTIIGKVKDRDLYSDGLGFNDKDDIYPFSTRLDEPDQNRLIRNDLLGEDYYDAPTTIYQLSGTVHTIINEYVDDQVGITDDVTAQGPSMSSTWTTDVSQTEPNSLDDATEYPNSQVIETQSGHVITLDDTVDNERIRIFHKSGSYMEIRPDGSFVQKCVGEEANHFIAFNDVHEHIEKGIKRYIEENIEEVINKSVKRNIKENLQEHIEGDLALRVDGNLIWDVGGNIEIKSGGTQKTTNAGNYTHIAPRIDFNP